MKLAGGRLMAEHSRLAQSLNSQITPHDSITHYGEVFHHFDTFESHQRSKGSPVGALRPDRQRPKVG
eukprot:scaffold334932_cov20-Prasinocladus_malaysianus.AAC.1